MNITFISASAGSGKTYRVVQEIHQRLKSGECQPSGLIATTFTTKAAGELKERLRKKLYGTGQELLAERLNEAAIGTVHSVCRQLLERFAFAAGISPQVEIITEEQAADLLALAIEVASTAESIIKLQKVAGALGQKNNEGEFVWQDHIQKIIGAAQANDFEPGQLVAMADESCAELLSLLPPATTEKLDAVLNDVLDRAIQEISKNGDTTKTTADYVSLLKESQRRLADGTMAWSDWVKLTKNEPGAKSKVQASPVAAVAGRYESHLSKSEIVRKHRDTISKVLVEEKVRKFGYGEETILRELLQNAESAYASKMENLLPAEPWFEFIVAPTQEENICRVTVRHEGRPFNQPDKLGNERPDIDRIIKDGGANQNTEDEVGRFNRGFKSVFCAARDKLVHIKSGGFDFKIEDLMRRIAGRCTFIARPSRGTPRNHRRDFGEPQKPC
jgi:ATP-dependent exoDNAse (exonuclease V) beta subunit